ncbi:MAG TPA: RIP metalloprotease RseP [Thiomicrospira sp.]|jgi:regulator of sigma E protease|nr:RIP metalloprotease RseP [Thiomicrospira sp.]
MEVIWSLLGFVVVMSLIVTIHEWGHYQVARWFNIKVLKFSIGFGKPVYTIQGKETEFVISQIPLGGFVKFADEREGELVEPDLARAFNRQSVYKRIAVVLAGPMVNLIFAWIVFAIMFMVGVSGMKPLVSDVEPNTAITQAMQANNVSLNDGQIWSVSEVNHVPVHSWQMVQQQLFQSIANGDAEVSLAFKDLAETKEIYLPAVSLSAIDINKTNQNWLQLLGFKPAQPEVPAILGQILEAGAAAQAGLKPGDKIISINEKPIQNWQDFVKVVQSKPNQVIYVQFERSGVRYNQDVKLDSVEIDTKLLGKIGAGVQVDKDTFKPYTTIVQYGFIDSFVQAYHRSVDLVVMSLSMLKRMLIGEVSTKNLSGPISIAQFSGQAIQSGLVAFLSFVGLISLSIGILNLLPIPVLDGGHLLYYLVEIVKGSPVSERVMVVGQTLGLMVLVSLTVLAVFNDVIRISHG